MYLSADSHSSIRAWRNLSVNKWHTVKSLFLLICVCSDHMTVKKFKVLDYF